jgi:quinol-cytochrome oxidoreductase complex cytochrome b subunit
MRFREVIRAPFWLLAFIYFLFISLVVAVWAALGNQPAFITWVFSTVLIVLIALKSKLVLEIDDSELRAGPAHIDRIELSQGLLSELTLLGL